MQYNALLAEIDRALARGEHLDDVDARLIEPADLDREQKAALWLYAFSRQHQRQQRRIVRQQLTTVGIG